MSFGNPEENWVLNFHSNPAFDEGAVRSLKVATLATSNLKANIGSVMASSAFLGQAMARWPDRFEEWMKAYLAGLEGADQARRSMLWFAIALSGLDNRVELIESITPHSDLDTKERDAGLHFAGLDIREVEPAEGWMLDLLWGAYFGSSDYTFLTPIVKCVPWALEDMAVRKHRVAEAAFWSVNSNRQKTHIDFDVMRVFNDHPGLGEKYAEVYKAVEDFQNDPYRN